MIKGLVVQLLQDAHRVGHGLVFVAGQRMVGQHYQRVFPGVDRPRRSGHYQIERFRTVHQASGEPQLPVAAVAGDVDDHLIPAPTVFPFRATAAANPPGRRAPTRQVCARS